MLGLILHISHNPDDLSKLFMEFCHPIFWGLIVKWSCDSVLSVSET